MKKQLLLIFLLLLISKFTYSQIWSSLNFDVGWSTSEIFSRVSSIETDTINNWIYAGGTFGTVNGISINKIAVWNGIQWDSLGAGFNDEVRVLKIYKGELYAGGRFTMSGNDSLNYIAKWDGVNWLPLGTGIAGNRVDALEVYNGELYVAGDFTNAGGQAIQSIAKWDGTNWTPVGTGTDGTVYSLHVYNNILYAGGWFSVAGSFLVNNIASWNGASWLALNTGTNGTVYSLTDYNNELILGGNFSQAGFTPARNIASWNGSGYDSILGGMDDRVYALAAYNCELYAGGNFRNVNGMAANGISKWNGTAWTVFGSVGPNQTQKFNTFKNYQGDLLVGGWTHFTSGNQRISKWNTPIPAPPSASFTSDTIIQVGGLLQFTNTSTNSTLQWSFQGGIPSTSTSLNPVINYPNAGVYDVTLIATNCLGSDTLISTSQINVTSTPVVIPAGISIDLLEIIPPEENQVFSSSYYKLYSIQYYKPVNYNPTTSPILLYIHGTGGSGASSGDLYDIAERQQALVVAPSMKGVWAYVDTYVIDTTTGCYVNLWLTEVMKQIYRHVEIREQRTNIPTYLTGFSQGGQFTTRYMIVRQFSPDSIPIRMAVSSNPANYTFMTDTLSGSSLIWTNYMCGLDGFQPLNWNCPTVTNILVDDLICEGHIKQYYNENYGVLIGTTDTQTFSGFCPYAQGISRYDRALNFYAFSDTNAISRGTTLQWVIDSVQGVGHSRNLMYNTKANPTDSFTIAESLLFDTPWHPVPQFVPIISFEADTNIAYLPNATVQFTNFSTPGSYVWNFGDGYGNTGTNPVHTYDSVGTYSVTLIVNDINCSSSVTYQNYITVMHPIGIKENIIESSELTASPNPFTETINIKYNLSKMISSAEVRITDLLGKKVVVHTITEKGKGQYVFSPINSSNAFYLILLIVDGSVVETQKIISIKE